MKCRFVLNRSAKLLWITNKVGLDLINAIQVNEFVVHVLALELLRDIRLVRDFQINYNSFNEPFAVSQYKLLYLDMHGLIFGTSIYYWQDQPGFFVNKFELILIK